MFIPSHFSLFGFFIEADKHFFLCSVRVIDVDVVVIHFVVVNGNQGGRDVETFPLRLPLLTSTRRILIPRSHAVLDNKDINYMNRRAAELTTEKNNIEFVMRREREKAKKKRKSFFFAVTDFLHRPLPNHFELWFRNFLMHRTWENVANELILTLLTTCPCYHRLTSLI